MSDYCVVIPAKNAARFLPATLESVLQQTCPAREIVVVDDGSDDATAEVARAAGVTVMSQSVSSGPAASRNRGVAATTAPLVAFLDADDEWLPDHAERLLHALAADGAVFAGSGAEKFGTESGVMTADFADGSSVDLRDALIIDNPVIQSAAMMRRSAFEGVGGYDEDLRMSEDYDLWSRTAELGLFAYVQAPTVRRRMHTEQATYTSRVALVRSGWRVRRRVVARRLQGATPPERERAVELLLTAGRLDIGHAIWTGESTILTAVREELQVTDDEFELGGRMAAIGGAGLAGRRMSQDLHCMSRSMLQLLRGER